MMRTLLILFVGMIVGAALLIIAAYLEPVCFVTGTAKGKLTCEEWRAWQSQPQKLSNAMPLL